MKKMSVLLPLALMLTLFSCEDADLPASFETLPASWTIESNTDSVYIFAKVALPPSDNYCITFKKNNTLIEQKNAGFCGTPPISYANFDGKWELGSDSILIIEADFWGGKGNYKWKINWLTNNRLSIKKLDETYTFKNN